MGYRVLVIEDNFPNLELMVYLLGAFGHIALSARDGEEGVRMAGLTVPDLILCDLSLPKLDGYGVVARLRADPNLTAIPVIAVTASAMVGDRDKVMAAGFDGYIMKPISPETFVDEIAGYVSGGRSGDDSRR